MSSTLSSLTRSLIAATSLLRYVIHAGSPTVAVLLLCCVDVLFYQDQNHRTDLDPKNVKGGDNLDPNYVLSSRVRTGRSIRGFSLPPHCSRAERRAVEEIIKEIFGSLKGEFAGNCCSARVVFQLHVLISPATRNRQVLFPGGFDRKGEEGAG